MRAKLSDCDIVGYSTSLSKDMVPTTVCPIFCYRPDGRIIFPSFYLDGELHGHDCYSRKEVEEMFLRRECTAIVPPFEAKHNYQLWIDSDMVPHYEPIGTVLANLTSFYEECIEKGVKALHKGEFEKADYYAGLALCARDNRVESLSLRYVVRGLQGRSTTIYPLLVHDDRKSDFDRFVEIYKKEFLK